MAPLEAWEKVCIDCEAFMDTTHGSIPCTDCHGGDPSSSEKDAAHAGVTRDPSVSADQTCAECHAEIVEDASHALHASLEGMETMIEARLGSPMEDHPELVEGYNAKCASCHATCGQCHVSRPETVEGGFVDGHVFQRTPDMLNQCTACHGSRIGDEFRGVHRDQIEGYSGDVHYLSGKRCDHCHGSDGIHQSDAEVRHAESDLPRCEDCHAATVTANDWHRQHWDDLSCQVCHAQEYKACASCHVPDGLDEDSWLTFKIGRNPIPDERRWAYVTLRHVPVAPDTYEAWGVDDLPEFEAAPTWKYAAPHNIVRVSSRTTVEKDAECGDACHESPATTDGWFLRQVDLDQRPELADANSPCIVPDTPATEWSRGRDANAPFRSKETP